MPIGSTAFLIQNQAVAGVTGPSTGEATMATKQRKSDRELIDTGTDKRYVRRDAQGRFKESDDVGRSLSSDRRRKAKRASKPGQGDRGDRKRT
jgi:hypothetical protein